jgi:hypothetical protein
LTYQTKQLGIKMGHQECGGSCTNYWRILHQLLEAVERLQNMNMLDVCKLLSGLMPNLTPHSDPPHISSLGDGSSIGKGTLAISPQSILTPRGPLVELYLCAADLVPQSMIGSTLGRRPPLVFQGNLTTSSTRIPYRTLKLEHQHQLEVIQ